MRPFTALCVTFAISSFLPSLSAQARRRIAILPADRPARSAPYGYQNPQNSQILSFEEKVADALLSKLASDPSLEILDRSQTQTLEDEQDNKLNDRFDPAQAAKLGKLQGVNVIIFVGVSDFQATTSTETANDVLFTKTTTRGIVHLNVTAKVVAVDTGAILAAPSVPIDKNEILSSAKSANSRYNMPVQHNNATSSQNAALLQLVDKAITEAADSISTQVQQVLNAPIAPAKPAGPPKVVGIDDGKVMVNRGAHQGLKVGDKFDITRTVDTGFKDPDTQQTIFRKKSVCSLVLSDVEDNIALGMCQGDVPQSGDIAVPEVGK